jgi:serine/threonine protein phosphatase PrpC
MPPKLKKARTGGGGALTVGAFGAQGEREYNEDVHMCRTWTKLGGKSGKISNSSSSSSSSSSSLSPTALRPVHLWGVFDGHGGAACSAFAAQRFPLELRKDLEAGLPPARAMVNATYATEVAFAREHAHDDSGTTAVCVLLDMTASDAKWITVSNVGDSRALLVRAKGKIIPLSTDQDGANALELRRIKAAGGFVDEDGYVNGDVQTARSIGDADAKFPDGVHSAAVVPTPAILERELCDGEDLALVLACDGLFEAHGGSNAWVNKMVRSLVKEGRSAQHIAEALVAQALADGSEDNTTAIVVLL